MNIFEGARRIAKLTAALIVVGFVANFFTEYYPPVSVSYLIAGATKPPVRVEQCEVSHTKEITSKSGATVEVNLCFRDSKNTPKEMALSPEEWLAAGEPDSLKKEGYDDYEVTDKPLTYDEWVAAGEPESYSALKSTPYKLDAFIAAFQIPEADEGYIKRIVWLQKAQSAGIGLLQMLASLAGFWLFVWTVGWIVRGFKGIPQGKDRLE